MRIKWSRPQSENRKQNVGARLHVSSAQHKDSDLLDEKAQCLSSRTCLQDDREWAFTPAPVENVSVGIETVKRINNS